MGMPTQRTLAAGRNELGEHAGGDFVEGGPLSCLRRTSRHQLSTIITPFGVCEIA